MSTLFIADLHLSSDEPAITAGFLAFLKREAIYADALYILGDLFEVWIGDDEPSSLHDAVADAIGDLHQYNVPCYFIHGNRDFLLGKRFAERSHIVLLPQESAISVYGHNVLILHGDTLCTDDKEYQKFRAKMYNPILRRLFFCLPLKLRQRIGATLRNKSKNKNSLKAATIMDVNENAVIERFMLHQTHCMIHGHTHRPAIHDIVLQDDHYYRIVLGAWHDKGSVLKFSPEFKFELVSFPLDKR